MTSIAVLGSTGSIGQQTLDVVRSEGELFKVEVLAAGNSTSQIIEQVSEFRPSLVVMATTTAAEEVREATQGVEVTSGVEALREAACITDLVVNAVVGFAGLPITMASLQSGRRLALANKESLIAAGPVVQKARETSGSELIPVDSEHCALHQCLRGAGENYGDIHKLLVTASGGPFREWPNEQLSEITKEDALNHPTWNMGPKITVDSSTLMNKGLEVIEAHELFGVPYESIEVVIHPQSIVHSMVEFTDGSVLAQLSMPDMRLPISYALHYPDRSRNLRGQIDWSSISELNFATPDFEKFPCLRLAYDAGRTGETAPAWLNAANEVAVQAFLDDRIPWSGISEVIERTLESYDDLPAESEDAIYEADTNSRVIAAENVSKVLNRG